MLTDGPVCKTPQLDMPDGAGPLAPTTLRTLASAWTTDAVPGGTITPTRLRTIRYRLATGFYDSDDVRDRIATAVGPEL